MFADSVIHGCGLAHQIKDLASIEHSPSEVRGRECESIAIFADFIGLFGRLAVRPQYGPQCLHRFGEGLVSVIHGTVHRCIMRRLSRLNTHMPNPRLIKLLQRLASTMV